MGTSDSLIKVPCPLCNSSSTVTERDVHGFNLDKCMKCGMVFANPQYFGQDLARLYTGKEDLENIIGLYERIATAAVLAGYNSILDCIEGYLPGRGRLLDYACAAGHFMEQASKRGWEAYGLDIAPWTRIAAERRGVANVSIGTLDEISFPDKYFDFVNAAQVFEHLPNPKKDLAEICRILRPGGVLYIDVPNYRTLPIIFNKDDFMLNDPPQHINYFTAKTVHRLLSTPDLEIVKVYADGGLKWENLFGLEITSEIKDAYYPESRKQPSVNYKAENMHGKHSIKEFIKRIIIKPLLYDKLKLGMNLVCILRRV